MTKYAQERIVHPQRYYQDAEAVANDAQLSSEEKQRVLDSMALNADLMAEATEEGMTGGEQPPSLQDIRTAREKVLSASDPRIEARFATIVVALNGDEGLDDKVAETGFAMASLGGRNVHVVNVIEPSEGLVSAAAAPSMAAPHMNLQVDKHRLEEERVKRSRLNAEIRRRLGQDQPGEDLVVHGDPSTEVTQFARDHDADLIVLGAADRSWFEKLLGISPTQSVAENAPCPVLVIPAASGR